MTQDMAGNNANNSQARMSLENRIRTKHNEIGEAERVMQSREGEIARIQSEIKRTADTMKRMEVEAKALFNKSDREKNISRQAEDSGRMKDQEITRKNDEVKKFELELAAIKKQQEEKEQEMHVVKEALRQLVKAREDFHKQFEAESFSSREGITHAHEKDVRLHQLEMENNGKEAEVARKEREVAHLKQDIMRKQQDLSELQIQLEHMNHPNR
jgi:chromosome segregation ATPase